MPWHPLRGGRRIGRRRRRRCMGHVLQTSTVTMTTTTDLMLSAIASWIEQDQDRRITIEHNGADGCPSFFTVMLMSNSAMVLHVTAPTLEAALRRLRDVLFLGTTGARQDPH